MFKFERHRNANALNYHRALLNTIRTVVVETQDLISHLWRQEANRTNSNKKYTHSQVETAVRTLAQNSPMNCTTYARVSIKLKKNHFLLTCLIPRVSSALHADTHTYPKINKK